ESPDEYSTIEYRPSASRPAHTVGVKLWVDDERPAPEGWVWVTRPAEAIRALATRTVTDLSLDHDLGIDPETNEPQTTRPIVLWLCEMDAAHTRRRYWPDQVRVHYL
ncbi:hypothetical protein MMAG44476_27288, partial [Mycolicibacterium mageritense DSM 44476 = CIP 104973]